MQVNAPRQVRSKFKTKTVNNKENPAKISTIPLHTDLRPCMTQVWNQAAKMQLSNGDKLKFSVYDQVRRMHACT